MIRNGDCVLNGKAEDDPELAASESDPKGLDKKEPAADAGETDPNEPAATESKPEGLDGIEPEADADEPDPNTPAAEGLDREPEYVPALSSLNGGLAGSSGTPGRTFHSMRARSAFASPVVEPAPTAVVTLRLPRYRGSCDENSVTIVNEISVLRFLW